LSHPRSLGISAPDGRDIYELYLVVQSRPSVLARIATILGEKNVDIIAGNVQSSDDKRTGYDVFYLEMAGATVKPQELVAILKKLEFVQEAKIEPRSKVRFETMMFPLTRSGHTRVFVLSSNGWFALVNSILTTFGTAGGVILHNQGMSVGAEVVESIKALFHGPAGSALEMDNLRAYFAAVGLGVLQVTGDQKGFKVKIEQPVTSGQKIPVVDQFLVGVVRGAVNEIYSEDYVVKNLTFKDETIAFELESDPNSKR
jgi:hypothetical protein